jgi:hypothetical protein
MGEPLSDKEITNLRTDLPYLLPAVDRFLATIGGYQAKLAAVTEIMRQYEGMGEGAPLNIIYEIRKAWHNIDAQEGKS